MASTASYGSWRSPITASLVAEQAVGLSQLTTDNGAIYWNERRPQERGRQVVMRRNPDGEVTELLPPPYSARTLVHEYGGQSYCVFEGTVYFSNFDDQRLYRLDPARSIAPITAAPELARSIRYADLVVAPDGSFLVAVRERHRMHNGKVEVQNDIVSVGTDSGEVTVLAEGADFYLAPRISNDGSRLAFLSWNHPSMPWDDTKLYVTQLAEETPASDPELVAGGRGESVSQPRFRSDNSLTYLSDRSGYYNLYDERGQALFPIEADCGLPDWVFGQSTYVILADSDRLAVSYLEHGSMHIATVDKNGAHQCSLPFTHFATLAPLGPDTVVALAGSASTPLGLYEIELETDAVDCLRASRDAAIDHRYLSEPRWITVMNDHHDPVHALYYSPKNGDFQSSPGERPPLIVRCHGGPTSNARALFDPEIQYFTSRGFAVADVDYGGSSGYGRAYRERLIGNWGELDIEDCSAVASSLADRGRVDRRRLVVRGSSAGGYTALGCLTFRSLFAAGASFYGISDLSALASETHKFESHYVDGLVGPYPQAIERYRARSPLFHARELNVPVIFFHGLDDPVVPPEQTEAMVGAMHDRGIPSAYLSFEGESHGFRNTETIVRCLEAELYFYGRVLDLDIADEITPVQILDSSLLIH